MQPQPTSSGKKSERGLVRVGPFLFQLEKKINTFTQIKMSAIVFYNKLKKQLWDELSCLRSLLSCNCSPAKTMSEYDGEDKFMQFFDRSQ